MSGLTKGGVFTVDLTGLQELEAEMDSLTTGAAKGALRRALKAAAQPMAEMARRRQDQGIGTERDPPARTHQRVGTMVE